MTRRFVLSPLAKRDLQDIRDYIAKDSTSTARRVLREIRDKIRALADRPGMGHRHESLPQQDLLVAVIYSYLIVYRRDSRPLEIVRVVSGYRDVPKLFE